MSGALGIPRWSWGDGAPGGWAREYLEWLARYRHTGVALDAPGWSCWLDEWPSWTVAERVAHVRLALASLLVGTKQEAHRTHVLRMSAPPPSTRREWSRLALTKRLAARMTLIAVAAGQAEEVCRG
jgi:hypothetical protein